MTTDVLFNFRSMKDAETQTKDLPTQEVAVQSLKRKHREVRFAVVEHTHTHTRKVCGFFQCKKPSMQRQSGPKILRDEEHHRRGYFMLTFGNPSHLCFRCRQMKVVRRRFTS